MTRNTIQPIGWLFQPKTNALAINPCSKVDKLIACTAIFSPASNIKETSVRVTLTQIGVVFKCETNSMMPSDK